MEQSHPLQVALDSRHQAAGEHRHAVLLALAIADRNLECLQVHILHPKSQGFQKSQPGAAEQTGR